MTIQEQFYQNQAETLLKHLEKRNMKGYYCATKEAAKNLALSLMPEGSSISWGGSMSLYECGLIDALYASGTYTLYDRSKCLPDQMVETIKKSYFSNFYLMSSNAITLDGQLVNIDGLGNRLSALLYGPDHVIMIVGMNKVTATVDEAISRIKHTAAPKNTVRLDKKTPCAVTGVCQDCLSPDCICMHTVITRNNRIPNRIHVILVGEELGY